MKNPRKPERFRTMKPVPEHGLTMWSVVDDELKTAIAMTWDESAARRIVEALESFFSVERGGR